jgi:oligopeptide transport system substrate-binding protein
MDRTVFTLSGICDQFHTFSSFIGIFLRIDFIGFMSKYLKFMRQVSEISRILFGFLMPMPTYARIMLQCSILLAVVASETACHRQSEPKGASGSVDLQSSQSAAARVLRRGLPGEPRTLDPQLADDDFSFQVVRDLSEGLTDEDPYGQIVPGVANSWTLDDTGTIYTFYLRSDAKWSNGDRITAGEFVQGLRRAVDPKTASGSAGQLAVIRGASEIIANRKKISELGVTAIDDSSLRILLEHPAPFILQILSQPVAAPAHVSANPNSTGSQSTSKIDVYSGAYILVNRVPGSFIELERNRNYWNVSQVNIEKIRYVNAESDATELREYMAEQLDMTFTIPMSALSRLSQTNSSEVQMSPTLGTVYLALNLSKSPLKDSRQLRQALSMAVDRELIAERVMMGVTPAYTFVADGTSGYDPPKYDWATWSRERQLAYARSLFERSGYSERNPLHLKLYFNNNEGIQRIMIAIAASWKQNLGIISELNSEEFQVFLAGRKDRNRWDIARLGWDADYDDPSSFLEIFSQGSNQNDPGYNSTLFNDLIMQARLESLPDTRTLLLRRAEQNLLNDYPIIPIYFSRGRRLVKPYVGGAHLSPMNRTYSKNLFWK